MPHLRATALASSLAASALLASTLVAGSAAADDTAPAPTSPVRFTSLAPDGVQSELSTRIGLHFIDDLDETLYSLQLDAQVVSPQGYGGYARVSAAKVDDLEAVGDLEIGGLYRIDRGDDLAITLRGGLSLPTATDGLDSVANIYALLMTRPGDLITSSPDLTALRLSVAPTYRTGQLVIRGDVGFDVAIDTPDGVDVEPLYHVDLGIGYVAGKVAATAELSAVGSTDSDDDGTYDALSFGAQYDLGGVKPSATIALPFDTADDDSTIDGFTILLGATGAL